MKVGRVLPLLLAVTLLAGCVPAELLVAGLLMASNTSPSGSPLPTAESTVEPTAESTVEPEPTLEETPTEVPASVPPAPSVASVTAAIQSHQDDFLLTNFDGLSVQVLLGTTVFVEVKPRSLFNEAQVIRIGSADALVVSKAVFASGAFPAIDRIHVQIYGEVTDQYGNTVTETAGWLEITADAGSRFDYSGMEAKPPSAVWCVADRYRIHPAIWKALNDEDKGCLRASSRS